MVYCGYQNSFKADQLKSFLYRAIVLSFRKKKKKNLILSLLSSLVSLYQENFETRGKGKP